jgi:hypothetical protein
MKGAVLTFLALKDHKKFNLINIKTSQYIETVLVFFFCYWYRYRYCTSVVMIVFMVTLYRCLDETSPYVTPHDVWSLDKVFLRQIVPGSKYTSGMDEPSLIYFTKKDKISLSFVPLEETH